MPTRRRRGSVVEEFVLCLVFLLMIAAGVLDTCWYLAHRHMLAVATHKGARAAAVTGSIADATTAAEDKIDEILATSFVSLVGATVTVTEETAPNGYSVIQVTSSVAFSGLTGQVLLPANVEAVSLQLVEFESF